MTSITVPDEVTGSFNGELLADGDDGYDTARRIHNGLIDRRPGLIARCANTADVRDAIDLANTSNVEISVRGGGHNVAGLAVTDGGVMVDLSSMRGIHVDPAAQPGSGPGRGHVERVQPGHPRSRIGDDRGRGLHDRGRRADRRWRPRLADGQVRHVHRQPGLRRGRPGRRSGGHRQRDRGPGSVLGDPRRRRQLRRGHVVRVRRPSRRHRHRRHRGTPARRGGRGARHVPPVHEEPRRRHDGVLRSGPRSRRERHQDRRDPGLPLRRPHESRVGPPTVAGVRATPARHDRPDAVSGRQHVAR